MPRPTLLLADDHAIVADGLRSLLSDEFDLVGVVHDGRALLEKAEQLKPALIVTDISMPGLNGLDAIRQLRKLGVSSKVIVLTMHIEPDLASRAFRAGVSGYLLKQSAGEELIGAIREVLKGRVYLTPLIAGDVITILMKPRRRIGRRRSSHVATERGASTHSRGADDERDWGNSEYLHSYGRIAQI